MAKQVEKNKESAIEALRREAEAEAKAELAAEEAKRAQKSAAEKKADAAKEKEFEEQDKKAAQKAAAKAKSAPAAKVPAAKAADKKTAPAKAKKGEVSADLKAKIRTALNETEKLDQTAKGFGVDVKAYAHLSGGLRKMSIVNKTLGSAVQAISSGAMNQTAVFNKIL